MTDKRVDLNPNVLLGFSQVLRVSSKTVDVLQDAKLLSKVGVETRECPQPNARLLSKIGDETSVESDVRLKRDIKQLATRPDGLPIYAFKYLWDDAVHVGVIAQDLLQNELWEPAVLTKPSGYYAVDYGRLGLHMATLDEWESRRVAALKLTN